MDITQVILANNFQVFFLEKKSQLFASKMWICLFSQNDGESALWCNWHLQMIYHKGKNGVDAKMVWLYSIFVMAQ